MLPTALHHWAVAADGLRPFFDAVQNIAANTLGEEVVDR
jgi:hypothetical protein